MAQSPASIKASGWLSGWYSKSFWWDGNNCDSKINGRKSGKIHLREEGTGCAVSLKFIINARN